MPGDVILRRGDLSDGLLHNWLVKANKVFVNNFGGVFAERCVNNGSKWHLDHYIAGLLASMEEETIIITLSDLVSTGYLSFLSWLRPYRISRE